MDAIRYFRCSLPSAAALIVLGSGLACGGGTGGDLATSPSAPQPPSGPTVTVSIGADVSPAVAANIVAFVSTGDSVSAPKGIVPRALGLAVDTGTVPVVAIDGNGNPLAAAFSGLNTSTTLTASSTALVLVRVLIPSAELTLPGEQTLRLTITQQLEFSALVDSVRAVMSRAASYATSPGVVAQAALVARAVIIALPSASASHGVAAAVLPPRRQRGTITVGPPLFTHYPVKLSASGGNIGTITFANSSFVTFGLNVVPQPGSSDELPGRTFCIFCIPPSLGLLPGTKGYPAPGTLSGVSTATVSFGPHEQQATEFQFVLDIASGLLRTASVVAPQDALNSLIGVAETKINFTAAAAQGSWNDAAKVLLSGTVAALPDIGVALLTQLPRLAGRAGTFTLLRALALPLQVFDNTTWAAGPLQFYSDAMTYWKAPPETVPFCILSGTLYNACAASVTVTLSSASVTVGQSVQATDVVKDGAGNTLFGLSVHWFIMSGPATVDQNGLVTAIGAGSVTVQAFVAGIAGSANLSAAAVHVLVGSNLGVTPERPSDFRARFPCRWAPPQQTGNRPRAQV